MNGTANCRIEECNAWFKVPPNTKNRANFFFGTDRIEKMLLEFPILSRMDIFKEKKEKLQ